MWVIAVYHQASMFSLKPADATSTGGRSLLVPTPFSIKMALLDVALRLYGVRVGSTHFDLIRDLVIAVSPPPRIVVNNCFVRILKLRREKSGKSEANDDSDVDESTSEGPFIRSVAFREYVQYSGPLGLACEVQTSEAADLLTTLLPQISYFGKRGSLFQIDSLPRVQERFPAQQGYLRLDGQSEEEFQTTAGFTLQHLDDCAASLTFERTNIYAERSAKTSITLGRERVIRHIVLPYQLTRSSRGFSLYERIDQ